MIKSYIPLIATLSLFTTVWSSDDIEKLITYGAPPPLPATEKITQGTYIPEFFYAHTKDASKDPLLLGPCSPCSCAVVCKPNSNECVGIHAHPNTDINAIVPAIDQPLGIVGQEKTALVGALFSRTTNSEFVKPWYDFWSPQFYFTEGTHKKRVVDIGTTLMQHYSLKNLAIYFNKTSDYKNLSDRWIVCKGLDENNQLLLSTIEPYNSKTLNYDCCATEYTKTTLQKILPNDTRVIQLYYHGSKVAPMPKIENNNFKTIRAMINCKCDFY